MKHLLAALAVAHALLGSPVAAQAPCEPQAGMLGDETYAVDPLELAGTWLAAIARLDAAIPSLSPAEEAWIEKEMRGDIESIRRVAQSREFAVQKAKQNTDTLHFLLRHIPELRDGSEQVNAWSWFAYTLIESDIDRHLVRLVAEEVIDREAIPDDWTFLAWETALDPDAIRYGRTRLARHVLFCTLPSVAGSPMAGR